MRPFIAARVRRQWRRRCVISFEVQRLWKLIARDPLFVAAFAILWLASLQPLWRPHWLPCLDLPNTLSAVALWHRYGDASWRYQEFYRLNLLPLPYWGYMLPVHLLAYVAPIEIANKLFLSAYALALPVGVALLARRMGRSHWLALFSFALLYNINFALGFVTFCTGVAVLPYALWALDRFLDGPTRGRAVALALVTLALYFSHVLPWLFFGLAAALLLSCHTKYPRRVVAAAALMLPSVLVAIYAFSAARDGSTAVHPGALRYEAMREPLLDILRWVPQSLTPVWPGNKAYYIVIALFAAWMTLLLTDRREAPAPTGMAAIAHHYRLELLFALTALCVIFGPTHLYQPVDLWMIGTRFTPVAAMLGALMVRAPIVGWRRLVVGGVVAISTVQPVLLARSYVAFDKSAVHARRVIAHIPRGSSTLTLIYGDGRDPAVADHAVPYLMFHAYAQLQAGGYDPWAVGNGFPMVPRPGRALPAPPWKHPEMFDQRTMASAYDFILTFKELHDYAIFAGPDDASRFPLVAADGDWRLYKVARE